MNTKNHWENVYSGKKLTDVSWYQPTPTVSWQLLQELGVKKNAAIIDVGGGDSLFVDFLVSQGFTDITVLDISSHAIERAKARLGKDADKITWIVGDVLEVTTQRQYDVWHDRAVLHFLTEHADISAYLKKSQSSVRKGGRIIISTFAEDGPEKCSGLTVQRYSESSLSKLFSSVFEKIKCLAETHLTPWGKKQNFIYCSFAA